MLKGKNTTAAQLTATLKLIFSEMPNAIFRWRLSMVSIDAPCIFHRTQTQSHAKQFRLSQETNQRHAPRVEQHQKKLVGWGGDEVTAMRPSRPKAALHSPRAPLVAATGVGQG